MKLIETVRNLLPIEDIRPGFVVTRPNRTEVLFVLPARPGQTGNEVRVCVLVGPEPGKELYIRGDEKITVHPNAGIALEA